MANRTIKGTDVETAFSAHPHISDGGAHFGLAWDNGRPRMVELQGDGSRIVHLPEFILGSRPLWQPLVPASGNRWQPTDMAYDVNRDEWFNVFGQQHRQPGEWGHWTGRGMNWNSMCAQCHMTGYQKNYDTATDRYASTWVEHGIGCIQCHGPMPTEHKFLPKNATKPPGKPKPAPFFGERARMMQTCAPCHARNEPLTGRFQPGDSYHDHYRVALPADPATFYPDGQQRDEVFNGTSFLLSRMGGRGEVTCLDCHDPHTTKTILPTDKNQLCLQCHAAPGRVQPNGVRAVPIDPLAHSHHAEGSTGNSCVGCHMPATKYMQRAPRHDHGWLIPDPLLNQELGIPDACSRCHSDKPVAWSVEAATRWYGSRLESRQRERARAIASAQTGKPEALEALLALWPGEEIAVWRATILDLLEPHVGDARVVSLAEGALLDPDPLVRASATRTVGRTPSASRLLKPLLDDPVRLVRLDAAWVLSPTLPDDSAARHELNNYLTLGLDQPGGLLRLSQDFANRGHLPEAEATIVRAVEWDPHSPGIRQTLGLVLAGLGRPTEAAAQFARAAELLPADGGAALDAALAHAEAGNTAEAERYLRLSVARNPNLDRAWYNLGLLLAQREQLADAAQALQQAERTGPAVADYPFALATVLRRFGDRAGARAAAERTLSLDPNHAAARRLLMLP